RRTFPSFPTRRSSDLLDLVPVLLEQRGDATDRAVFLVGKLGIGVDLAGEPDEVVAEPVRGHLAIRSRMVLSVARRTAVAPRASRSEEHTSELQSRENL